MFSLLLVFSLCIPQRLMVAGPANAQESPTQEAQENQSERTIQFVILEVECVDRTTDVWWGKDEIALGGVAASKLGVDRIAYRDLGEFDSGTIKDYDWVFAEIPIDDANDYTGVHISLVEMDSGGKEEFLATLTEEIYQVTRDKMLEDFRERVEELEEEGNGIVQASSADLFRLFGWLLGQALEFAVSEATDYVVGSIWDWLVGLFNDDPFVVQFVEAPVTELFALSAASNQTPFQNEQLIFEEHDGIYHITYTWRITDDNVQASSYSAYEPTYSFDPEIRLMRGIWLEAFGDKTYVPFFAAE
ncbi:MAG: hypothetical protein AAF702_34810 [Chloroflexota bacterium]